MPSRGGLGDEIIPNNQFDTATGWSISSPGTISGGIANLLSSDGSFKQLTRGSISVEAGKTYRIGYFLSRIGSGVIRTTHPNLPTQTKNPVSLGLNTVDLVATGTGSGTLAFARAAGVTDLDIDFVTLREVL